ncbi:HBR024Cp [Eremothecium sinecaudum]|uniref:HBR024Cp n=1 Tax=Eremothecium sinecaudum TaxID=45286 RepID=A0A125RDY6_9SACH|nr:HBR024Cp [Eremothecium sinecaudum]AMD18925.1 HBR024Cp [Eremothecium sinecaudum]
MFKKVPEIGSLSNLKNSERKRLQNNVKEQTAKNNYQLPTSVIKQTTIKTQTSVGTVYADEDNTPIFFKTKHSVRLYPTVYTCWKDPNLIPIIYTHEHVISKLKNGADLMLPGTIPPFPPSCIKGALVGVASSNHPGVIKAVGECEMDLEGITKVIGTNGVAVKIYHTIDDGISQVFKINFDPPNELSVTRNCENVAVLDCIQDGDSANEGEIVQEKGGTDVSNSNKFDVELNTEDIDHFLTRAMYYTLTADSSLTLPIPSSTFISSHVMKNLPPISPDLVTLKRSSWAKASKFLKHFETEGFIKLKGKAENLKVVSIHKDKHELKTFEPYRTVAQKNAGKSASSKATNPEKTIEVVSYFQPKSNTKQFLEQVGIAPNDLFQLHEVRELLNKYIANCNLVDPGNKTSVLLNDTLFPLVYKTVTPSLSRSLSRSNIVDAVVKNSFNEYSIVYKDGSPLSSKPFKNRIPKISVITETKIHKKIVTRVFNFEFYGVDAEKLAYALRKRCSGSTTIGETVQPPKTQEVQVQGPHGSTVMEILNEKGIPNKYIDFSNLVKSAKKKK